MIRIILFLAVLLMAADEVGNSYIIRDEPGLFIWQSGGRDEKKQLGYSQGAPMQHQMMIWLPWQGSRGYSIAPMMFISQ